MLGLLIQAEDTLSTNIPSFSDRFNFAVPLIVILFIIMFFLLLKSNTGSSKLGSGNKKLETKD